jgi:hypothetical protein
MFTMKHICSLLVLFLVLFATGFAFAGETPQQQYGMGDSRNEIGTYACGVNSVIGQQSNWLVVCYTGRMTGSQSWNANSNDGGRNLAQLQYEKENTNWNNDPSAGLMFLVTSQGGAQAKGDAFLQAVGAPVATIALSSYWNVESDRCKVPEPASLILIGSGLVAMAGMLRRKLLS